jgi:hypothetical protein
MIWPHGTCRRSLPFGPWIYKAWDTWPCLISPSFNQSTLCSLPHSLTSLFPFVFPIFPSLEEFRSLLSFHSLIMHRYLILIFIAWTLLVGVTMSQATGTGFITTTSLSISNLPTNLPTHNINILLHNETFPTPWAVCMATETSCALPGGGNTCCSEGFTCVTSGANAGTCFTNNPGENNPDVNPCAASSADLICNPVASSPSDFYGECCNAGDTCSPTGCVAPGPDPNDPGNPCDSNSAFVTLPEPGCCAKDSVCTFNKDGSEVSQCCEASWSCTWMGCENLQFSVPKRRRSLRT